MKRRLLFLALAGQLQLGLADTLPGEVVARIGQVAVVPADARRVPGQAGAWRPARSQSQVLERIQALEGRRTPPCTDVQVVETRQAAPDLFEGSPRVTHHVLDRWTVRACGTVRQYDAWYRFEKGSSSLVVIDNAGADFQAQLDAPYRRLRALATERAAADKTGLTPWINLPVPAGFVPALNESGPQGWRVEFVPRGQTEDEWLELISVQGLPRRAAPGQALTLLEGMQETRASRCGIPAGPVELRLPGHSVPQGQVVQTYLICPRVLDTNYAELSLVKAIEGPDWLYVVQRTWRLPASSAERVQADSHKARAQAEAFLAEVRLCHPVTDAGTCPAAFPR
ncbi:MAG: hypothetical protein PHW25_19895 [Zoogloea sp.]|uniref:hypothetical protein n=1 Tax=Zoogloea sp. TaxID=49181 RepID=UPI00262539BE|nr:hypothetical protein [Zoogloea sp.]MDD3329347.1 hypothetical protein [Zoogloea sp.]